MPAISYVLPFHDDTGEIDDDLVAYLGALAGEVTEVMVVDGSCPDAFARHGRRLPPGVGHVAPDERTRNGKVGNVVTGVRRATHEVVVIADDDLRWTAPQMERAAGLLREHAADVVRPQNVFVPTAWHTHVDTARTLLARATGGDWPGTLVVRRDALLSAGGYRGDVLFENLELVRTLRARGGRGHVALDLVVARRPPTARHFRGQQVRQAYDEVARPARLVVSASVLPLVGGLVARRRWRALATGTIAVAAIAELGRRRGGGRRWFPARAAVVAPPWLVWRSLCTWAALGARLLGGVRYRDCRLANAATPLRVLRAQARGRPAAEVARHYAA